MKRCTKPSAVPRNLKQPKWQILHNCPESHNDFLVENQRPDEDAGVVGPDPPQSYGQTLLWHQNSELSPAVATEGNKDAKVAFVK